MTTSSMKVRRARRSLKSQMQHHLREAEKRTRWRFFGWFPPSAMTIEVATYHLLCAAEIRRKLRKLK